MAAMAAAMFSWPGGTNPGGGIPKGGGSLGGMDGTDVGAVWMI